MINALLTTLLKVVFFIVRWLTNIILLPITLLINGAFPDLSGFFSDVEYFLNEYFFKSISFAKEVFFNMTGFPPGLLSISAGFAFGSIAIIGSLKLYSFIMNAWRRFKGG